MVVAALLYLATVCAAFGVLWLGLWRASDDPRNRASAIPLALAGGATWPLVLLAYAIDTWGRR